MSKKEIISTVLHNGTAYTTGMEEELARDLSDEQIKTLTAQGVLSGSFSSQETPSAEPVAKEVLTSDSAKPSIASGGSAPKSAKKGK